MRCSFKCQSHWAHILQNKDSLFVKCCLLSESLATMQRALQPRLLRKTVSGSPGRGAQLPTLFSGRREILSSWLDIPKHSVPGQGLLPTGRGQASRPGCHPAPALPLGLAFYSLILLTGQNSQQPIIEHHRDLPSHANAGRSGTRPCTANVRAFQKIH